MVATTPQSDQNTAVNYLHEAEAILTLVNCANEMANNLKDEMATCAGVASRLVRQAIDVLQDQNG